MIHVFERILMHRFNHTVKSHKVCGSRTSVVRDEQNALTGPNTYAIVTFHVLLICK